MELVGSQYTGTTVTSPGVAALRMMGQMPGSQSLSTCAGSPCDIMTTMDPQSKEEHRWYFNVEIPMKREAEALRKSADKK